MDDPAQPFRFLDLPVELRVTVYGLLLDGRFMIISKELFECLEMMRKQKQESKLEVSELYLRSHCARWSGGWSISDQIKNVSLLLTSRQFHQEAAPILYNSRFGLQGHTMFNKFVDSIGTMRSYVKRFHLLPEMDWTNRHTRSRTLQLSSLTNLHTLSIYCGQDESEDNPFNLDNLVANIAHSFKSSLQIGTARGGHIDRVLDMVLFTTDITSDSTIDYCELMEIQFRSMLRAALEDEG